MCRDDAAKLVSFRRAGDNPITDIVTHITETHLFGPGTLRLWQQSIVSRPRIKWGISLLFCSLLGKFAITIKTHINDERKN